ncbi:unnamed protein product, partial [Larinioides sclopetarius]
EFFKAVADCTGSKVFRGVYTSDRIPVFKTNEEVAKIVNTDIEGGPGKHWLGFFIKNDKLEFFDSFGQSPDCFNEHIQSYVSRFPKKILEFLVQSATV